MPEGDTITKLARFLDQALSGQRLRAVRLHPAFGPSAGAVRIQRISAHGKHLSIVFDNGHLLRSHLGLHGSWHRYRVGEPWRRPRRQLSLLLDASDWDYVCFNAKEIEWLKQGGFGLADRQQHLGRDLIAQPLDPASLLVRARQLLTPATLLVDVLLDQRLAAGIGNVYKSELLFLERYGPLTHLGALNDDDLLSLYRRAVTLLGANLGSGPRTTRFERDDRGSLWVYGRRDQPCLRSGAPLRRAIIGARPRSTYWCAHCQQADTMAAMST
ncbi:DNA-formamidopyrimidine glycosylase family protein [Halochromatium salexigens]|uniref:DNA-(apurinic or apyrimidinic site) lyase n=1 Tax=Halochromatium salexigens TaxID=49447 RepID=A0AAJ0UGR6_HALSE|nr:DNA-formamidopyrimidine glycosylase family protein [Halochromatium salexigens]MBK5931181.1 hypothetical protein [Halochromatium salexigens]